MQSEVSLEKGLKKSFQRLEHAKKKDGAAAAAAASESSQLPLQASQQQAQAQAQKEQEQEQEPPSWEGIKSSWSTIWSVLMETDKTAKYSDEWRVSREHAMQNSLLGGSALLLVSVVRRLVFKI